MYRFTALLFTIPLATIPLTAQTSSGKWSFGLYGCTPDFGMYFHQSGDSSMDFDTKTDLDLKNNKMGQGVRLDYSGRRFGFSLDCGLHDFAGQNRINREIEMDGEMFPAGGDVTSSIKNTTVDLTGTVKILSFDHFWFGVDFGLQAWIMNLNAEVKGVSSGGEYLDDIDPVSKRLPPIPIPQLGLSLGVKALNNRLELRGKAHLLAYSGAKYTLFSADARCYVLSWLGVRAFMENQRFDVPYGSIDDDMEARIDNNRVGFGVALRW